MTRAVRGAAVRPSARAHAAPPGPVVRHDLSPKPKSFTGEDVVEFHIHGGRATVDLLLKTLAGINQLRLAEPGEFSKRAFINNKMDLTAIEAMGDLINAQTELQHNQALSQMDGSLNKLYLSWRKSLIELVAYLEADIDFAEEDIPDDVLKNINLIQYKLNKCERNLSFFLPTSLLMCLKYIWTYWYGNSSFLQSLR